MSVTEQRVWHLEQLRHDGSGESGHEDWHVQGRVAGRFGSSERGSWRWNRDPALPNEADAKRDARVPNVVQSYK